MSAVKIICPKCGRILGDTDHSLDGLRLNCAGCRQTVAIKLTRTIDDFNYLKRKESENDKSK